MDRRGQSAAAHLRAGAGVALQPGVILSAGAAALRGLQEREKATEKAKSTVFAAGARSEVGTSVYEVENASNKFSYLTRETQSRHMSSAVLVCHSEQHPPSACR